MITSVTLSGLEIGDDPFRFSLHRDSLPTLRAGVPRDTLLTEMQARSPVFNRQQPTERTISLVVIFENPLRTARVADFLDLDAATGPGLVPLSITEDGVTKTYIVSCSGPVPSSWYERATITAIAADPVAT